MMINQIKWLIAGFADLYLSVLLFRDLPFTTHFSLGNGERYNYKGKKTFGSWYNKDNI